ncbi:hypothetical protein [Breoghania sp. L-A4]|uniref:hypothetical protein n=1 Tax=Breoghania sp. L-A4 TaxID=2304600 RepID=UPI0020BF280B|nr:hypothetical protein [Breoghania sp. L-A4]
MLQAGPLNVDTVMIAGEFRKRGGALLYGALAGRLEELAASSRRILSAALAP